MKKIKGIHLIVMSFLAYIFIMGNNANARPSNFEVLTADDGYEFWLAEAELGDPQGMTNLAHCYYTGNGVKKDYAQALYWWEKAASNKESLAMVNLGYYYYNGEACAQDLKKAAYWWTKAAEAGQSEAQLNLAICYLNGYGVTQDQSKAISWLKKASANGNERAKNILKDMGVN